MAATDSNLDMHLSPSIGESGRLCFLVGAGISHDLASTPRVIEALLRVLLSPLGHRKAAITAHRLLTQSIQDRQVESPIRFEYLLQLVKDYFGTTLTFLKRLYDVRQAPNSYHMTLARIALQVEHPVFTTNFDRQIENASRKDDYPGVPLQPVFRDWHFRDLVGTDSVQGLLKLHGSVHDVRTLGATFDATTLRGHQEKRRALEMGLQQGALCVLGYSGGDDTDVVPTVQETPAVDHSVYWFLYDSSKEPVVYRLDHPDGIPDDLKQTSAYRILEKMVRTGARRAERVFLIVGRTEEAFERFLALRGIEFLRGTSQRAPILEEIQDVIQTHWYAQQGEHRDILAMMTAIVLSYLMGKQYIPQALAKKLEALALDQPELRIITWPKLAMAAYDADHYTKAVRLAKLGIAAASTGDPTLAQSGGSKRQVFALQREAEVDSYVWLAEARRMQGRLRDAIVVGRQGLTIATAARLGSQWRRLRRLKGDLLSAIGESYLDFGQLRQADHAYQAASVEYERAAEWNWYWYARLGLADILKTQGHLSVAAEEYQAIIGGSSATGWRTWFFLQVRLSELDIQRVRGTRLSDAQQTELNWLATQTDYDEVQRFVARTLLWDFSWLHGNSQSPEIKTTYDSLVLEADSDEETVASLRLSHAEFNKRTGDLAGATEDIQAVRKFAVREGHHLLDLHARCIHADVQRLRGEPVEWEPLRREYREAECIIGEFYATVIGSLGEAPAAPSSMARLYDYAQSNGISLGQDLHPGKGRQSTKPLSAPLLFPGF